MNVEGKTLEEAIKQPERNRKIRKALVASGVLAVVMGPAIKYEAQKGKAILDNRMDLNNKAMDVIAAEQGGLNNVNGGFTTGFKNLKFGKAVGEAFKAEKMRRR